MTERELVRMLGSRTTRLDAMRRLVGGVNATELRAANVSEPAFRALADGVGDPDPQVRWWSIQLLDHVPDARAIAAIAPALRDPVPRVRRNAAHALGCVACKPGWDGTLPRRALDDLAALAAGDPNAKVRREAQRTLTCLA